MKSLALLLVLALPLIASAFTVPLVALKTECVGVLCEHSSLVLVDIDSGTGAETTIYTVINDVRSRELRDLIFAGTWGNNTYNLFIASAEYKNTTLLRYFIEETSGNTRLVQTMVGPFLNLSTVNFGENYGDIFVTAQESLYVVNFVQQTFTHISNILHDNLINGGTAALSQFARSMFLKVVDSDEATDCYYILTIDLHSAKVVQSPCMSRSSNFFIPEAYYLFWDQSHGQLGAVAQGFLGVVIIGVNYTTGNNTILMGVRYFEEWALQDKSAVFYNPGTGMIYGELTYNPSTVAQVNDLEAGDYALTIDFHATKPSFTTATQQLKSAIRYYLVAID